MSAIWKPALPKMRVNIERKQRGSEMSEYLRCVFAVDHRFELGSDWLWINYLVSQMHEGGFRQFPCRIRPFVWTKTDWNLHFCTAIIRKIQFKHRSEWSPLLCENFHENICGMYQLIWPRIMTFEILLIKVFFSWQ